MLTEHLHAWGKTLQRLRRPGRCLPKEGTTEPDMQPLGRPFIGQPIEPDLARYSPHPACVRILKPLHGDYLAVLWHDETQAQPCYAHASDIPAPPGRLHLSISPCESSLAVVS